MTYLRIALQGIIIAIYCLYPINTYCTCYEYLMCQHLQQQEWNDAVIVARKSGHKFLYNIALTQKFLNSKDDNIQFESIISFLQDNPHYPMRNIIIKTAEKSINCDTNPCSIVKWFQRNAPLTPYGHYRYALAAHDVINESVEINKIIYDSWINCDPVHIRSFLDRFADLLRDEDYSQKIQRLIVDNKIDDARSLMSMSRHCKLDWQVLHFMINAAKGDSSTQELFSKLSDFQRNDLAVIYIMLSYGAKKKIYHEIDAVSLFTIAASLESNQTDHFITNQQLVKLRNRYARELVAQKQYDEAYKIVQDVAINYLDSSSIDAQWLAGWIALRFQDNPQLAIKHFNNILFPSGLENGVQPTRKLSCDYDTLSKFYYWLGRSYKDQKDTKMAEKYFNEAAQYQYNMYGQLAIMETQDTRLLLTPEPQIQPSNIYFQGNEYVAAAEVLLKNQLLSLSKKYALYAIDRTKSYEEAYSLLQRLMHYTTNAAYIAALSKRINSRFFNSIYITSGSFPTPYDDQEYCIEKDVLYSIVRQESVFDQYAISGSNAYGLMQLLPSTAQEVANKLKTEYNTNQLLSNAEYNLKLGSYYFKQILDSSGSYAVAIASYNAGPARVRSWIQSNGNPFTLKDDPYKVIDWIEMIPFDETRVYTQKVIENMHVYRAILNQRDNKPYYISLII